MPKDQFDIAVIGGGPGGYVAAIRAAQLGLKTAVIEREHLGGICLNWGCIPTKALLRSSEIYHLLQNLDAYGFSAKEISFDIDKIVKRSRKIAKKLSGGVGYLMKKNNITVIKGTAKLQSTGVINVVDKDRNSLPTVTADHIIIATGARARTLPGFETNGDLIWTYKKAMVPDHLPKSIIVIGSGAIGIEFASFYRTLGVEITVVEIMDRILPVEDAEISALARKAFEKQGMTIHTNTTVGNLDAGKVSVAVTLMHTDGRRQKLTADRVILAVGITGNVEMLGLEEIGVTVDRGHVVTDDWCRTNIDGIYAIGDVSGQPWLAHKASHEGILCVEKIAGVDGLHPLDTTNIPGCTYCWPQVASVGLTEQQANELGHEVRIGRFPFLANGKAIALGETEGLIKTVFDEATGELLGAHMIGADVTELIQGFGIAKTLEATETDLIHTVFPHPTLSEMMHESVLDAYDRVIHL